ncbi:DUF3365 domain-containing protein [Geovibrio thiophilus]|uniref:histidine kinase n=1 Tax=Geovibrio thiophilus TaxID=139438 RepID=A0A410JVH0_9BACT|nr:DUF3365 domain-containing protein [Geovibrio thiophilus]QAR32038.1 DUF3365 domain-containing protein [Geovibrio thiophilus]
MKLKYLIPVLLIAFFAVSACLFELYRARTVFRNSALAQTKQIYDILLATRQWNAMLGWIYAPVSDDCPPNPYLQVDNRDVRTESGELLTMVNPAYMTRQIGEIISRRINIRIKLTGNNPLRPENAPAPWEAEALKRFEQGQKEYYLWEEDNGSHYIRYAAPLFVQAECLHCHDGYSPGEVLGGLSIVRNLDMLRSSHMAKNQWTVSLMFIFGSLAVAVIYLLQKKLEKADSTLAQKVEELNVEIKRREESEAAVTKQTRLNNMTEILRSIAHHWRQPMNSFCATVQHLQDSYPLNREDNELVEETLASVVALSGTIDNFTKVFARTEQSAVFDLCEALVDIARIYEPYFKENNIRMTIKRGLDTVPAESLSLAGPVYECGIFAECSFGCLDGKAMRIKGDLGEFRHLISFFITNAIESVQERKLREKKILSHVDIEYFRSEGYYCIRIADNGTGISNENFGRLFEPYFSTKGCGSGRGLGLYMASDIADKCFGGSVHAEKVSDGASFIIQLRG